MKKTFPQANNIELMFQSISDLKIDEGETAKDFAERIGFEPREGNYYLDALWYIGAVKKESGVYYLSPEGLRIRFMEDYLDKLLAFVHLILKDEDLKTMYVESLQWQDDITARKKYYERYIGIHFGLNEVTAHRRASTVHAWFSWMDEVFPRLAISMKK